MKILIKIWVKVHGKFLSNLMRILNEFTWILNNILNEIWDNSENFRGNFNIIWNTLRVKYGKIFEPN